ncbi:hypothetical protein ACFRH4_10200 [Streptomyces mirabilis]|uniref:hypothetical protein n=1 Tax=Streptomyces mirabilis TaxID=68239 RepID=UPI00369F6165
MVVQALVLEPVSRLLPDYAHRVTALTGILVATLAHPPCHPLAQTPALVGSAEVTSGA